MDKKFNGYHINIEYALSILLNIEDFVNFSRDVKYIDVLEIDQIINKLSNGRTFMINNQSKEFFYNHSRFINDIRKTGNLYYFITTVYDRNDNVRENYQGYYEYLIEHKDQIERIHELLVKIEKMGISSIVLNESEKFDMTVTLDTSRYSYSDFAFGNNIKIIPTYEKSMIRYYFDGTNYIIPMINDFDNIRLFVKSRNEIIVNSLTFDPELLPKSLSKDNTLGLIIELRDKDIDNITKLRDDIDLTFGIGDLLDELDNTYNVTKELTTIEEKDQIIDYLNEMRNILIKIKTIHGNSEEELINDSDNTITQEIINKETKEFVKRRINAKIDLC